MDLAPKLIDVAVPASPDGAVLVLHGGAARGENAMVSPTQLSVLRMIPIARRIARAGRGRLAVFRLLNSARGWDTRHTPVADARWALDRIIERYGGATPPICLVGHSLGGRAALLSAAEAEVASVAALAPWVYPDDIADGLSGEQILIVHGDEDRVAKPERSRALAQNLRRVARVSYVTVEGGRHAMLAHASRFDGLAADFATATLLGTSRTDTVARVQAGEPWITV